jgi:hypothetical protein
MKYEGDRRKKTGGQGDKGIFPNLKSKIELPFTL